MLQSHERLYLLGDEKGFSETIAKFYVSEGTMKRETKAVDVETVVGSLGFGRYHVFQYALVLLTVLFTAASIANYIFVAKDISYRCVVPECESAATASVETPSWWPETMESACSRPELLEPASSVSKCTGAFSNTSRRCDSWVYSGQDSILPDFDLACKPVKRTLVGTFHNAGMLVSMPLLGFVSDKWGRKVSLIISAVGLSVGLFKTIAPSYDVFVTFEFLEAMLGSATYTSAFVLLVELGGKSRRVMSAAYIGFAITVGEVLLAVVAQSTSSWRNLIFIAYTPTLLFLSYILLLEESVRWLLINGKTVRAKRIIEKAANMNNITLSPQLRKSIEDSLIEANENQNVEKFSLRSLASSTTILKRLLISSFWWFSGALVYYGMMINSVSLPGNKYVNFMLTAAVGIPGDLFAMLALSRFGRKKTLMTSFIFCGVCCVCSGFVPKSLYWLGIIMFLLGKLSIVTSFNGIYIYCSELFPTNMRNSLVGFCSMCARIGSIIAPLTPLLSDIMESLPTIIFGGVAIASGVLMLFTPETHNQNLPDNVAQAENVGKASNKINNA